MRHTPLKTAAPSFTKLICKACQVQHLRVVFIAKFRLSCFCLKETQSNIDIKFKPQTIFFRIYLYNTYAR